MQQYQAREWNEVNGLSIDLLQSSEQEKKGCVYLSSPRPYKGVCQWVQKKK